MTLEYVDLVLSKHLILISMLKTVVLLNIFVEILCSFFFFLGFFDE